MQAILEGIDGYHCMKNILNLSLMLKQSYMKYRKLAIECVGTFILVLIIDLCRMQADGLTIALASGSVLAALVFAGGHISGAHFNPAVTLSVFLRGKCSAADVPSYIFSQFLGASVAALLASTFFVNKLGSGMDLTTSVGQALLAEILGSFFLCWVVLNVATSKDTESNSFYGLAIGMSFMAATFAFGPISAAAFNPAVALSFGVCNISGFNNLWIYFVSEVIGAVAACYFFLFTNGKD